MHPTKKRGSPNTSQLGNWTKYLNQLLQNQYQLRSLRELSNASGIPMIHYGKNKNNLNRKIKEATAVVNHLRKLRYGNK